MPRLPFMLSVFVLLVGCQPVTPVPVDLPAPAATVVAAGAPTFVAPLAAPDGQRQAVVTGYGCTPVGDEGDLAYEQLALTGVATPAETLVASQTIACGGLGAYGLAGLFWSANSRYFYYTTARTGVPDGCGYWAQPITRLDVATLATTELGGGVRSPDGSKLATWQGHDLAVWDVESGDSAHAPAARDELPVGPIAWSPDGTALVYLQVASFCPAAGDSALVRLDLAGMTQSVVLVSATPTFAGVAWDDPDVLTLTVASGELWRYDFTTQALTPAP